MYYVDLNSDLGESFGNYTIGMDAEILKYVSSANVACGWHAGDPIVVWDWRDPVDYSVEYDHSGVKEDSLFSWRKLDQKDKYQVYLDGNHALTEIQTEREDKERLLVIKDSYAHVMVPYLVPHFSEILMADLRYYRLPLSDLIREHQIDRILIVYSLDQFCNEANLVWLR